MPQANAGCQFDHAGTSYYLPRLTEGDKDRWHVWCNAYARRQLAKDRAAVEEGWVDYADYALRAKLTQDRLDSGYYHYDEPGGQAFLSVDRAFVALVWVCMARHDPAITLAQVQRLAEQLGPQLGKHWAEANANPTQPGGSPGKDSPKSNPEPGASSASDSSATTG